MRVLREWIERVAATVWPGRRDADLEAELRLHLELAEEDARRRGHDPQEARRLARLVAGQPAAALDAMRDQRALPWLEDAVRDVGYGVRTLRRRPGFTLAAVLSLALGIGANSGIFSVVDQVLLRNLPVTDPERLVHIDWNGNSFSSRFGAGTVVSYPLCRDLQALDQLFEGVFCRAAWGVNFSAGQPYEVVHAEMVSGSYFSVLGVRPAAGRLIGVEDDVRPGAHPVVVLSHDFWANRLGSAPDAVGRSVFVNSHPMTVIGVAGAGFRGMDVGEPATLWVPTMMAREVTLEWSRILDRRAAWLQVFARLRDGVSPEEAQAGLRPWFAAMLATDMRRDDFPPVDEEQRQEFLRSSLDVLPAAEGWSMQRLALVQPLWLILIGTTLLLLLACLNVANLFLARGAERAQELATRMALGASRPRVARQLLLEGLLVAAGGGLLGLAVAPVVAHTVRAFLPAGIHVSSAIDWRILLFTIGVSLAAGVLSGVAPARQAMRQPIAASIHGRATAAPAAVRFRKVLVVAQLAFTVVLLVGAGLFLQTLERLHARDRGYDSSRLLMFRVDAAGTGYPAADAPGVMREVLRRVQAAPGVEGVALANNSLLGSSGPTRTLLFESNRELLAEEVPTMRVSEGFFATVGVRVQAGREFDERDTLDAAERGIRGVIVNESFATRYFGDRSPVGERVGFGARPDTPTDVVIVGVVRDFSRRLLREDQRPDHLFVPFAQTGSQAGDGTFYVNVRGEPAAALDAVRAAVASVDGTLPLTGLTTLEDQVTRALARERMLATLATAFGTVALVLSVVGLFGVMAFTVTQRTPEIGMRMALGATRAGALRLVLGDALVTIGAGATAGLAAAVAATLLASRWLSAALYGVSPSDMATFAGAGALLVGVALAASAVPAARAASLSPMAAIREQPDSAWQRARSTVGRALRELTTAGEDLAPGRLMSDVTAGLHRAVSFPNALQTALDTLREHMGARSILLLEKRGDAYCGGDCTIPSRGALVTRFAHYPHPLPIAAGDLQAWEHWARECRPAHIDEIACLARSGARMAVPLRTTHDLVGILLLGAPGHGDEFTSAEVRLAGSAADVFALLIENARLNERSLQQERLRRDLALAAEVQQRLLPESPPTCPAATFAAFTLPARSVGGDYYDFIDLPDGWMGLAVADIAGKGIPAALLMSALQASLRVMAVDPGVPVARLAAQMNRFLHRATGTSSYATFFYAQFDPATRRLRYVNAGHVPPYVARRTGTDVEIMELSAGGTVLGLFPDVEYDEGCVELRPGDLLVACTDGVTEARSAAGEEFGEDRLQDLLRNAGPGASAQDVAAALTARVGAWTANAEQHDDITFVVAAVT